MGRFDRYLLYQFSLLFGFFSLVLVAVYWVNRAVVLFDQLIANGESALVFLEFILLTLPNVVRLVLPISAFAAVVYVINRLSAESELVVVQATGFSPWRLARPAVVFGALVALTVLVFTNYLVPVSTERLNAKAEEVSQNVSARLLTEGRFLHPAPGLTLYIREITPGGELRDIYLSDARSETSRTTYMASRALLVRADAGPSLVMFDGEAQTLDAVSRRLSVTAFQDFAYDISGLISASDDAPIDPNTVGTLKLLFPDAALEAATGQSRAKLLYEGHNRITQALLAMVAPIIGMSVLMLGSFSRFGLWRQIGGAVLCLIIIKSIDNATVQPAREDASLWALPYIAPAAGLALSAFFLYLAARPRPRRGLVSGGGA